MIDFKFLGGKFRLWFTRLEVWREEKELADRVWSPFEKTKFLLMYYGLAFFRFFNEMVGFGLSLM